LTFQKSYDIIFIESKESIKVATEKKIKKKCLTNF
jgi:hypothetical protein